MWCYFMVGFPLLPPSLIGCIPDLCYLRPWSAMYGWFTGLSFFRPWSVSDMCKVATSATWMTVIQTATESHSGRGNRCTQTAFACLGQNSLSGYSQVSSRSTAISLSGYSQVSSRSTAISLSGYSQVSSGLTAIALPCTQSIWVFPWGKFYASENAIAFNLEFTWHYPLS